MPYVKPEVREELDKGSPPDNPGELNYVITKICIEYSKYLPTYQVYNDIIGALECCKFEMYRRRIANYEDSKILTNGDVY